MLFDGHTHFISPLMIQKIRERTARLSPNISSRLLSSKIHDKAFVHYLAQTPVEEMAKSWNEKLKNSGVSGSLFIPVADDIEGLSEFLSYFPKTFFGLSYLDDPLSKSAP
ncbi:MAG: hypothetical protein ACE5FU_08870, partial [Nitrospinota bacterium]